ncbi:MAG: hypothetical protein R2849_21410 [Thermomicrobiales bacterium]
MATVIERIPALEQGDDDSARCPAGAEDQGVALGEGKSRSLSGWMKP